MEGRDRALTLLMALNGLLFAVSFLTVGLFNRPSADDFHYLALVREHGVWDAMVLHYHHWNPRWASTLVVNGFFRGWQEGVTLPLLHSLTVVVGWAALLVLFRAVRSGFGVNISGVKLAVLALFLLAGLFHVSFGRGDTWYWLCSVPMYLWGVLAMALGFGLLMMNGGLWWRIPAVAGVFLYVGGSSEPVAACALILLVYVGLVRRDNVGPRIFHVATVACLVAFLIDVMGSGVQVRMEHLPHPPLSDRLWIGMKNYGRLILFRIPSLLPALLAFLLPIAWLGLRHGKHQAASMGELYTSNRHGFVLADLWSLTVSFMLAFVLSDVGPDRAWTPISVLLLTLGAIIAFQMGSWLNALWKGRLFHVTVTAQVLLALFQVGAFAVALPKAQGYAAAHDARMQAITAAVDRGDTLLELQPLPDAGWLHSAELTPDTAHHFNRHLSLHHGNRIRLFVPPAVTSGSE